MARFALKLLVDAPVKSVGTLVGVVISVFLMLQQTAILLGILARVAAFADASDADILQKRVGAGERGDRGMWLAGALARAPEGRPS